MGQRDSAATKGRLMPSHRQDTNSRLTRLRIHTRSMTMYTPTQRLMRSRTDKLIAGVAGGIGQYLAIDPVLVRLAFIALCFTGVGVLLYPVLWLIMPIEGSQRATPDQAFDEMRQQAQRVSDEMREVFVSQRRPRFDPLSGQPVDPESE